MTRAALIVEFCVFFVGVPVAYRFSPIRIPVLPILWAVTLFAWILLLRDPQFDRMRLWNAGTIEAQIGSILAVFAVSAALIWLGVHRFAPQLEWGFVRQQPAFWSIVMILYPALSVYPQNVVYRAFIFQRYAALFPGKSTMIVASAAAFALMHIVFRNWIAVALTFAGGLLFAWRYDVTGSLAASSLEQSLYGCWLFTVGLGQYFYHGTMGTVGSVMRR